MSAAREYAPRKTSGEQMTHHALTNTLEVPRAPWGLARLRRRLVLGPASVQDCHLGQGHGVDLPPERHLYF